MRRKRWEGKIFFVYGHKNKINGKWYIGITNNIKNRWRSNGNQYLCKNKNDKRIFHQPKFARAILKYGWDNFEHIIFESEKTMEEARELEKEYILKYNSVKNGYNSTYGGEDFALLSDEARQKMSEAKSKKVLCITTGEIFNSTKKAAEKYNIKFSANISEACLGKKITAGIDEQGRRLKWRYVEDENPKIRIDKQKRKIMCITTGEIFDSLTEASKKYNVQTGNIASCARGDFSRPHAGSLPDGTKLKWKYLDNESKNHNTKESLEKANETRRKGKAHGNYNNRKILCIELNKVFDSVLDAADFVNVKNSTHISSACKGKRQSAYGYHWKYAD